MVKTTLMFKATLCLQKEDLSFLQQIEIEKKSEIPKKLLATPAVLKTPSLREALQSFLCLVLFSLRCSLKGPKRNGIKLINTTKQEPVRITRQSDSLDKKADYLFYRIAGRAVRFLNTLPTIAYEAQVHLTTSSCHSQQQRSGCLVARAAPVPSSGRIGNYSKIWLFVDYCCV